MGTVNSKSEPCPWERLLQARRDKAKSMRYTVGVTSPFYFLCKEDKIDEVRRILDDETSPSVDVLNQLQPNGSTALHAATYFNNLGIVQLLLERHCPRTTLNRFGYWAYEEAQTEEMRQLFHRHNAANRFHDTNTANTMALYLPDVNIEGVNASKTFEYVQVFNKESEILEYTINQQTKVMWLKFYDWFMHTFQTFIEQEELHIDAFDLNHNPDFQQFLKHNLSESDMKTTMKLVEEAHRRNSVEPLITLYTNEKPNFYRPFNELLAQPLSNIHISKHLCDPFITEFHIHRDELKRRAYTGTVYRGATVTTNDLLIYQQALRSDPPGVIGFKTCTSTSRDPLVALKFALTAPLNEGQKHVIFALEIAKPTSTIFGVDDVSEFSQEQEVLILPGNLFIVDRIEEYSNPSITRIYLKHWHVSISFWKKIKQTIRAGRKPVIAKPQMK